MPAEPTKAKLKRRTSRKDLEEYRYDGAHGRELELKRNRGAYSTRADRRPLTFSFHYTSSRRGACATDLV